MAEGERLPPGSRIEMGVGVVVAALQFIVPNSIRTGYGLLLVGILTITHGAFPAIFKRPFWDAVNRFYAFAFLFFIGAVYLVMRVANPPEVRSTQDVHPKQITAMPVAAAPAPPSAPANTPLATSESSKAPPPGKSSSERQSPEGNWIFRDAPELTPIRQRRIKENILAFRSYLQELHLDIPDAVPPIGVDSAASGPSTTAGSGKYYYDSIVIAKRDLDSPKQITKAYSQYAIGMALHKPLPKAPETVEEMIKLSNSPETTDILYRGLAALTIHEYFNWSFWDKSDAVRLDCPYSGTLLPTSHLWELREQYGKDFTDKLVAFTAKTLIDIPYAGTDFQRDFHNYFFEHIIRADSVINNQQTKLPTIRTVFTRCGWLRN